MTTTSPGRYREAQPHQYTEPYTPSRCMYPRLRRFRIWRRCWLGLIDLSLALVSIHMAASPSLPSAATWLHMRAPCGRLRVRRLDSSHRPSRQPWPGTWQDSPTIRIPWATKLHFTTVLSADLFESRGRVRSTFAGRRSRTSRQRIHVCPKTSDSHLRHRDWSDVRHAGLVFTVACLEYVPWPTGR